MKDLVALVREANSKRKMKKIERRMLKLTEEVGEAAQAYLSVSSDNNSKNKSWADVREELTDVIIVATDVLLTRFPDEEDLKEGDIHKRLIAELERKLVKLRKKSDADVQE